jgi:DMSO reductase anchor subunit
VQNNNSSLSNAVKYLAFALILLFSAPILVTIGFKALKKDNTYLLLILGIILAIAAISVTAMGIVKVTRYIFDKDNDKN